MKISFFTPTEYVTWVDYSTNPDCLGAFDVDFNPEAQIAILEDGEVVVTDKPKQPESPTEKHDRIYQSIITAKSLDKIDLEKEEFSDIEIGDLITAKVFENNPHAEKALTNKALAIAITLLQWGEMTEAMSEKIAYAHEKKSEVDAVRNLFNLGNL